MSRLIDADYLLSKRPFSICGGALSAYDEGYLDAIADAVEAVRQVPTIAPESLRPRGTWEGTGDGYADGELVYDTWTCSECGYTAETDEPDYLTKFCPNCGAKMEGGHNP